MLASSEREERYFTSFDGATCHAKLLERIRIDSFSHVPRGALWVLSPHRQGFRPVLFDVARYNLPQISDGIRTQIRNPLRIVGARREIFYFF